MKALNRTELRSLVIKYSAVFDASAAGNPFSCADWILLFLDQVARDDWVFWLAGSLDSGCGLTLLYSETNRPHDALALTNYYASLYSPFISATEPADCSGLVPDLTNASTVLATVNLAPMAEAQADRVEGIFRHAGWVVRRYTCFGNWYLPCAGLGFAAYMAARPTQLVNTWKRKAKKFHGPHAPARLQLVTSPGDVDAAMQAYEQVYAKSWKVPEPYPRFVAEWATICAKRGWLRLGIAWVGSTPIAVQFWFTMNRRAYIFKLAYDEEHAKLSAGTVLSAFLFEHSLDVDQVAEIDYLTGDDQYKRNWMGDRRERVGVIACNPRTWHGLMRGGYEFVGGLRDRWRSATRTRRAYAAITDDAAV